MEGKTGRIIPYRKVKYKREFVIIELRICFGRNRANARLGFPVFADHPAKILPHRNLKWLRLLQSSFSGQKEKESFRDFPAPRIGAARRDASPYHWFRGSGLPNATCKVQAPVQDTPFYTLHFTFYILPARWWVLCAAFRRATASRKAVTTDVKDQINLPITAPNTIPRIQIITEITFCRLVLATARTTVLSVRSATK